MTSLAQKLIAIHQFVMSPDYRKDRKEILDLYDAKMPFSHWPDHAKEAGQARFGLSTISSDYLWRRVSSALN